MGLFGFKAEKANSLPAPSEYDVSCRWLNEKTREFRTELRERGIVPQSGFELERAATTDGARAFAVNPLRGLAFDCEAEKAVIFSCGNRIPETAAERESEKFYYYQIVSFRDIESVAVEIGANPMYRSGPFRTNTNIGSAKAVEQVSFSIATRDPALPLVRFAITKIPGQSARQYLTDEAMTDTTISVFSGMEDLYLCTDRNRAKKNAGAADYYIERATSLPQTNGEERLYNVDYREKLNHLEIIINRLYYAAMETEAIIRRNVLSGVSQNPWDISGNTMLIENEKSKLLEMKESGFLSKEEFSMLLGQLL